MRRVATTLQRPGAFTFGLVAITLLGLGLRLSLASESLFADELATYWVVSTRNLVGVVRTVATDAEITPPLYFVLAKASRLFGNGPELLRLPSLVAGTLTIPLVGLIGARTVGRAAGTLAMILTASSPFMTYYSAEARGYALMMACVAASTLAMLLAVDTDRRRWWGVFAVATAAAVYSHYTCVFALAAQLIWLIAVHPRARRSALTATAVAVLLFLPWLGGFRADLDSPTGKLLAALSPLRPHDMAVNVLHWAVGYPYAAIPATDVPGVPALALPRRRRGRRHYRPPQEQAASADRRWPLDRRGRISPLARYVACHSLRRLASSYRALSSRVSSACATLRPRGQLSR